MENTVNSSTAVNTPVVRPLGVLMGPVYDSTLILGVMLLALVSGGVVLWKPELFMAVFLMDIWLLGYHHVIATFTKLGGTPEDRAENRFFIYVLPFLVLAGVGGLYVTLGLVSIVTVYFFWQWYHYTRQSYGISVFYRRKSGFVPSAAEARLDYAALWAFPVWGLVNRCAQGWDQYLFLPIWMPPVPWLVLMVTSVAAIGIITAWGVVAFINWYHGKMSYASLFFMLSHHIIFLTGYVLIRDINVGWLVANIWHNAQYILFVWLFNKNRFETTEKKRYEGAAKVLPWLSENKPYKIMLYFLFCLIVTSVFYKTIAGVVGMITAGDAALFMAIIVVSYQTLNFHHYIVDSKIWKARKKVHREIMQVH